MNKTIETFTRTRIKKLLQICSGAEQFLFKRMYSDGKIELSIENVVDVMPSEKLDWALTQIENTIAKKKNHIVRKWKSFTENKLNKG